MVDALIGQIGELPGITVRPLSTVARYSNAEDDPIAIGRALGVTAVLEGSVQKDGDSLRVTARLLRVSDGRSLWNGRFDEPMSGIFEIQDGIARLVMQTLAERLGTSPPAARRRQTLNADAYQLYVSGVFNWQRTDIDGKRAAVEDFNAAISEDPGYALAWASLAGVRAAQSAFGLEPAIVAFPEAKQAAQRAIELDGELAEAQAAMGQVLVQYEHRFAEGEKYYQRARELNPNLGIVRLWTALNYLMLGRKDEALAEAHRAQELEPSNLAFGANVARVLYYSHDYEGAIGTVRRLLVLVPTFDDARSILGRSLLQEGRFESALPEFKARTKSSPGSFGDIGRLYAASGKDAEARAEIEELRVKSNEGYGTAYDIAGIFARLGDHAAACEALELALHDHSQSVMLLRLDPDFDGMRDQPCVAEVSRALYTL
jgi:serine/threonine-protein kinase